MMTPNTIAPTSLSYFSKTCHLFIFIFLYRTSQYPCKTLSTTDPKWDSRNWGLERRGLPRAKTPPLSAEFSIRRAQVVTQSPPNHWELLQLSPGNFNAPPFWYHKPPALLHLSCFPRPCQSTSIPSDLYFNTLTLGDNALHTDDTAEEAGGESPGGDMLGAKAALQSYVELLILLGVGSINGGYKIL